MFLAPSNRLQDASVRVRPDVVSLVPPIVVNTYVSTAHLDDGCHADEVVEFVASLQFHSGGESVRYDVLKRFEYSISYILTTATERAKLKLTGSNAQRGIAFDSVCCK